jgi:hypothetical protein
MVQTRTAAMDVRSNIMLNTGRSSNSRIVTYSYGYRPSDGDADLELKELGGCTGRAIEVKKPVVADLVDAKSSFEGLWKMTQAQ